MSLLNLPQAGTRTVLIVIYRLLLQQKKSINREELVDLCAPKTVIDQKTVNITLNTWVELGLFEEIEGRISISENIPKNERDQKCLSRHVRERVLASCNNEKFWEVEKSKSADFSRAISWLYAQDVYQVELKRWEGEDGALDLIKDQVVENDSLLGKNDTRWNGLKHWLSYLGFGWIYKNVVIIDPSVAIRESLTSIFAHKETISADQFKVALSEKIPILDGGLYRAKVEETLGMGKGPKAWKGQPPGQLSTSLSRGLYSLIKSGDILTEDRSDSSERVILTGREGNGINKISHFTFKHSK